MSRHVSRGRDDHRKEAGTGTWSGGFGYQLVGERAGDSARPGTGPLPRRASHRRHAAARHRPVPRSPHPPWTPPPLTASRDRRPAGRGTEEPRIGRTALREVISSPTRPRAQPRSRLMFPAAAVVGLAGPTGGLEGPTDEPRAPASGEGQPGRRHGLPYRRSTAAAAVASTAGSPVCRPATGNSRRPAARPPSARDVMQPRPHLSVTKKKNGRKGDRGDIRRDVKRLLRVAAGDALLHQR